MKRYNTTTVLGVGLFHLGKRLSLIARTGEYADELPEAAIMGSNIMDHGLGGALILYSEELIFGEEITSSRFLSDLFSVEHVKFMQAKGFDVVTPATHNITDLAIAANMIGYSDQDVSKVLIYMKEAHEASTEQCSILDAWDHVSNRFLSLLGGNSASFDEAQSHDNTLRLSSLILQMIDPRGHFDPLIFKKIIRFDHYGPEVQGYYDALSDDDPVKKYIQTQPNGFEAYAQTLVVKGSTDVNLDDIRTWKKAGMKRLGRDLMKKLTKKKTPLINQEYA